MGVKREARGTMITLHFEFETNALSMYVCMYLSPFDLPSISKNKN